MPLEATCFLVDLSKHMVENGYAQRAATYIEQVLFEKCKKSRKTDWVSYYLVNHSEVKNELNVEGVYQVMNLTASFSLVSTVELMRRVRKIISAAELGNNDISLMDRAILLSVLEMNKVLGRRRVFKQVVCFTDLSYGLELDRSEITELLQEYSGRFILVNCQESSMKSPHLGEVSTTKGELWEYLIQQCPNSFSLTLDEILACTEAIKPLEVKPVRIFTGSLRLGADAEVIRGSRVSGNFPPGLPYVSIQVEGYPATKSVQSLNRKAYVKMSRGKKATQSPTSVGFRDTEYVPTLTGTEYEIQDSNKGDTSNEPGRIVKEQATSSGTEVKEDYNRIAVSKESITKAYRYGSDYVVLPSMLINHLYVESTSGIDIRGFVDISSVPRHYLTSESMFLLADTRLGSDADVFSFNALVTVMIEDGKMAVARYVSKDSAGIQMCILIPLLVRVEGDDSIATLILNRLPFAEDERISDFPKLIQRKTTSGKLLSKDSDIEEGVDHLMSEFIDHLDSDEEETTVSDSSSYYTQVKEGSIETTLPLPIKKGGSFGGYGSNDRLSMTAIIPHRQQQLLFEHFEQLIVKEEEEGDGGTKTYSSDLPHEIHQKLTPHRHDGFDISKLTHLLDIKKVVNVDSRAVDSKDGANNYVATEEGPPLENLLRLGRKEEG